MTWAIRGATVLDLTSVAINDEFQTTLSGTQSFLLTAGTYYFQAFVKDFALNRYLVGSGQIQVGANLEAIASPFDGSTEAQKMLKAVEAAIKARLEGGAVDSYEIRGRNLRRTPLPQLIELRSQLRIEVAREQSAAGLMPDARRLFVRWRGVQ